MARSRRGTHPARCRPAQGRHWAGTRTAPPSRDSAAQWVGDRTILAAGRSHWYPPIQVLPLRMHACPDHSYERSPTSRVGWRAARSVWLEHFGREARGFCRVLQRGLDPLAGPRRPIVAPFYAGADTDIHAVAGRTASRCFRSRHDVISYSLLACSMH
jgi:hypothetical protein